MDPQVAAYLGALLATVLGLLIAMVIMYKTAKPPERPAQAQQDGAARQAPAAAAPRGGMGRMRAAANEEEEEEEEDEPMEDAAAGVGMPDTDHAGVKKGQKYLKKQQLKEETRKMREAEAAMRKKKKEEEAQELAERKEQRAAEAAEQARVEEQLAEEEEKRRKELEKKQAEEAAFWRKEMQVVAEGNAQIEAEERARSMAAMAEHVRKHKVVLLEELSSLFSMRTKDVIACLKQLEADGAISGVIDDRGKFIYIRPDELDAVARFIKKRGRVSIEELAAESNRLINLNETPAAPASASV